MDFIFSTTSEKTCWECGVPKNPVVYIADNQDNEPIYICLHCAEDILRRLEGMK